uniref:Uncharacterized protein n=1 Tax=Lepeophtheirus salmonis TaxID=72036 RepID=A0A0K2UQ32_LEPSM
MTQNTINFTIYNESIYINDIITNILH